MLVGIVKKNAIMMIDFAINAQREHGKIPADAIHEGCLLRFRPIMMTTMAALMATLPIALGLGAGGDSRPSARPGGRRRIGRLAMPDALHHAGGLSLPGIVPPMVSAQTRQTRGGSDGNQSGGGLADFKLLTKVHCASPTSNGGAVGRNSTLCSALNNNTRSPAKRQVSVMASGVS